MSNDNKTLADVQPDGMVRLGDQAERARFEVWCEQHNYSRSPAQNNCGITVPERYGHPKVQLAWEAWQAALSAQPSPGGQDALDCIGRIEEAIEFRVPHDIYAAVHGELAELKAALAARQPVGEPPISSTDSDLLEELDEAAEHGATLSVGYLRELCKRSALALRTAAPVAVAHAQNLQGGLDAAEGIIDRMRKEGCPPPQAVDLDELRRAACVVNVVGQIDGHDVVRRDSVLDVIDTRRQRLTESQAVGNG